MSDNVGQVQAALITGSCKLNQAWSYSTLGGNLRNSQFLAELNSAYQSLLDAERQKAKWLKTKGNRLGSCAETSWGSSQEWGRSL